MDLLNDKNVRFAFGAFIRTGRKRLGLTQSEVATALHTTQSVYSCYESGRRPVTLSVAVNICRYLDLDFGRFVESLFRRKSTVLPLNKENLYETSFSN